MREPVPGYTWRPPGTPYGPTHQAVDIPAPQGTPVLAVGDGIVQAAGDDQLTPYNLDWSESGGGKLVTIKHAARLGRGNAVTVAYSQYAHLASIDPAIRPGVLVREGQRIGTVGATGRATGPHLHFGFRLGGIWQDYQKLRAIPLSVPSGNEAEPDRSNPDLNTIIPMPSSHMCPPGMVPAEQRGASLIFDGPPDRHNVCTRTAAEVAANTAGQAIEGLTDALGDIFRNGAILLALLALLILGAWALVRQGGGGAGISV